MGHEFFDQTDPMDAHNLELAEIQELNRDHDTSYDYARKSDTIAAKEHDYAEPQNDEGLKTINGPGVRITLPMGIVIEASLN